MLDTDVNRKAIKWRRRALLARAFWEICQPLFCLTPRQLWWLRNAMLRCFGAKIGQDVRIHPTAKIAIPWNISVGDGAAIGDRAELYSLGKLSIGARATISQQAYLCGGTHDYSRTDFPLIKASVSIEPDAWICARAFIGPNVSVGRGSIVAAGAVAVSDVAAWSIVAGNPAKFLKARTMEAPHGQ